MLQGMWNGLKELWTPAGATYNGSAPAGRLQDTGEIVEICKFEFKYTDQFGVEQSEVVFIPRTAAMSKAHVEDMAAHGYENFLIEQKQKNRKRPATLAERKEMGRAIEDFRKSLRRRQQSTNNKLYY